MMHRLVRRWWPLHPHLIRVIDMATVPHGTCWAVIAWKWRCLLCGREYIEREGPLPEGAEWLNPEETA